MCVIKYILHLKKDIEQNKQFTMTIETKKSIYGIITGILFNLIIVSLILIAIDNNTLENIVAFIGIICGSIIGRKVGRNLVKEYD